jgi:probable phosphomutase (TIGR03848 family)
MAIILLIRHGENEYVKKGRLAGRLPEVHLNEKGRQQAQAVAEKLAGAPVKAVYSSPLERTMETAEPIAKALGLEVIPRQGLIETDFGEWQDKKVKGLSRLKVWRIVQFAPALMRFPQGESFAECQFRMVQEIESLRAQHDPKDVIACVSHSDPIKLLVAYYLGLPLDLFQRLHISPASITTLGIGEGFSHLLNLNYDHSFTLAKP